MSASGGGASALRDRRPSAAGGAGRSAPARAGRPAALEPLFEPRSIAVVGASADPEKRGHQILRALGTSGYRGRVYAVNRGGDRILGHRAFRSVGELPEAADLAVLSIPAALTPKAVRDCGRRGVRAAVILAVGFGESGPEGARLEDALRRAGRETGVRLLGPNTSGLMNLPLGVNLIGARGIRPGGIALLVQSGNIALALMNEFTRGSRLGISVCCGIGNEVDVGFGEVLDFLGGHRKTRAIVAHIESCADSRALLRAASAATRRKPVLVLKSGRTPAGAQAARSHTGGLGGPYDRLRAGFRQAGLIEVSRTDELVPVAAALATQPAGAPGKGVAVLSDGGGQSTLAVDALVALDAPLAELSSATSGALRETLGPAAAVRNPVDVAGAADSHPAAFARALEALGADPAVGTVLVIGMFGGYAIRFAKTLNRKEVEAADAMAATMRTLGKGLVVHSQFAGLRSEPLERLRRAGVPVIGSLEAASRAAAALHRRGTDLARRPRWTPAAAREPAGPPHPLIRAARAEGRVTLSETEARVLLGEAGLGFPPMEVVRSPEAAAAAAGRAGRPVAIKLLSRRIVHKSEAGGVALEVAADDGGGAAAEAFRRITASARAWAAAHGLPEEPGAATVSPMLPKPAVELLVGVCRVPGLGPVLTLGAGGTLVEVLGDAVHRVLPVGRTEVEAALAELKVRALLDGPRGRPAVSRSGVFRAVSAVAACLVRSPEVAEVEVNPLFGYPDRAVPADARVILKTAS